MGSDQRRLKNLLINPRYQLKYVFWTGFTGLTLVAVNGAIFYYYIRENYTILVELSPMTEESKAQLFNELNQIVVRLGCFSLLFIVIVSFLGLVFSHKVAGPLYHFRRIFNEIKAGKPAARVNLRPTDEFQDVALAFNEMMDSLKS